MDYQVTAKQTAPMQIEAQTRNFTMKIDEREEMRGDNEAPNPIEYQLASLAGCLNVVGTYIAQREQLDIRNKEFNVEAEIDPEGFKSNSNNIKPGLKEVTVKVDVQTTEEKPTVEEWLRKVEQQCPITDTLRSETSVEVGLTE